MEFGCSQCLAAAIESHQFLLIFNILQRPVAYRDIFWAPMPNELNLHLPYRIWERGRPMLYKFSEITDFSFLTRENCGHEHFEDELKETIPLIASDKILVALLQVARWHSSLKIDAEQMLRDSGKFDFTEPQLYSYHHSENRLRFEMQRSHKVVRGKFKDNGSKSQSFYRSWWSVTTYNSSLSKLCFTCYDKTDTLSYESYFLFELRKAIERGDDLNDNLIQFKQRWNLVGIMNKFDQQSTTMWFSLISSICIEFDNFNYYPPNEPDETFVRWTKTATFACEFFAYLLRNDISYFYETDSSRTTGSFFSP